MQLRPQVSVCSECPACQFAFSGYDEYDVGLCVRIHRTGEGHDSGEHITLNRLPRLVEAKDQKETGEGQEMGQEILGLKQVQRNEME